MSWFLLIVLVSQNIEIKSELTQKEYPDASALILLDRKIIEIHKDRSTSISRLLVIKVFDDRGISKYGDIKERYIKGKQEFQIITARTHTPDGREITVESAGITDLSAPEAVGATHTNVRIKTVSFPALEPNAIIEYEYKIVPKKGHSLKSYLHSIIPKKEEKHFFGDIIFTANDPILKKEFGIIVPPNVGFKYKFIKEEMAPKVEKILDKTLYSWELKDIPAIVSEPHMPPIEEVAPRLIFTSFPTWNKLAKWLADKFYNNIKANREMKYEIWKLTQNKTEEEIIRDCFLYVTTQIRNIIPLQKKYGLNSSLHTEWLVSYIPNDAVKVYTNKYGTPIDKAVLLCTFLTRAGINAFPVFVNTKGVPIDEDIASPSMFNHIIVAIQGINGFFLMDPQATDVRFGYLPEESQGVKGFLLLPKDWAFKSTLTMPGETNMSHSKIKFSLSEQGDLTGEIYTELTGFYDRRARRYLKNKTNKEKDMWVEEVISTIATNVKLISYSFSDLNDLTVPVEIHACFDAKEYASVTCPDAGENNMKLQLFLPRNPLGLAAPSNYVSLSERKYPLIIRPPREIRYKIELEFPDGFAIDYLPEVVSYENEFAKTSVYCQEIYSGDRYKKIVYNSALIFKKQRIEPYEYSEFKAVVSEFLKSKTRMIILKKV